MNFLAELKKIELDRLYFVREMYILLGREAFRGEDLVPLLEARFAKSGFQTRHAKLTKDALGTEVDSVEAALGLKGKKLKLFDRDRNRPWRNFSDPANEALVAQLMDDIDAILAPVKQLYRRSSCFRVRVGCTRELGEWPLAVTCEEFRDQLRTRVAVDAADSSKTEWSGIKDGPSEFELLMEFDLPQHVRFEGTRHGKYDLVVASRHPEATKPVDREDRGQEVFPMRLLMNRKNPMGSRSSVGWESLSTWTLLLERRRVNPRQKYPRDLFPQGLHIEYVNTSSEAISALRAAGGGYNLAYLGFPHLLAPDDRLELRAFALPGLDDASMTYGLAIPRVVKNRWPSRKKEVVIALSKAIKRRFERIRDGAEQLEEGDFQSFFGSRLFTAFFVTHLERPDGDFHWMKSQLKHIAICEDSSTDHFRVFFRGDLVVRNQFDETEISYDMSGNVYRDDSNTYHITAHAKMRSGPIEYEDFSIVVNVRNPEEPWVGYWMGQSSYFTAERFTPTVGYFIIWPNQTHVPERPEWNKVLGRAVHDHVERVKSIGGGGYSLPVPGEGTENLP